jgi:hypothetical protein
MRHALPTAILPLASIPPASPLYMSIVNMCHQAIHISQVARVTVLPQAFPHLIMHRFVVLHPAVEGGDRVGDVAFAVRGHVAYG